MTVSDSLDAATLAASRVAAEHADAVDRANRIPEQALAAMRGESLLSLLVPSAMGGQGRPLSQVASVCHALARSCGSSAMIFAMHQIQVVMHRRPRTTQRLASVLAATALPRAVAARLRHVGARNRR